MQFSYLDDANSCPLQSPHISHLADQIITIFRHNLIVENADLALGSSQADKSSTHNINFELLDCCVEGVSRPQSQ